MSCALNLISRNYCYESHRRSMGSNITEAGGSGKPPTSKVR